MTPWLSDDEKQWITEELFDAFDYTEIGTEVVYHSVSAHSYSAASGIHTMTDTTATLNALKCKLRAEQRGTHETGQWAILIHAEDLGAIVPKVSDRVMEGSEVYEVESAERALLGKLWLLKVRKH